MTPDCDPGLFEDCLSVDVRLPFAWQADALPDHSQQARSLRMLELAQSFEDLAGDVADDTALELPEKQLLRLEQKLDFTLEMIGSLLALQRPAPPAQAMRLSMKGLCVGAEVISGSRGVVRLNLHPTVPEPLAFAAEVISRGGDRASLRFLDMAEDVAALLERAIFRLHRRSIAASRRS